MSVIRLKDKIPEVYTNTSRDFQLLTRLYDIVLNGLKFDIDSILDTINTTTANNKIMQLLQTKLGFLSDKYITDEDLRTILKVFPLIVKNKGSKLGIEQSVRTFFKVYGIDSDVRIHIVNDAVTDRQSYIITIDLRCDTIDTTILDEILKYIIPTGYIIEYNFITDFGHLATNLEAKIGINLLVIKDSVNSLIRGNYISYRDTIENNLIGTVGLTNIITNECTPEYMGLLVDESELITKANPVRGHTYILRTEDPDLPYKVFIYDYDESGELNWIDLNSTYTESGDEKSYIDRYNVFNSAVYGYYHDGKFYANKINSSYDTEIDQDELPDTCYIVNATVEDAQILTTKDDDDINYLLTEENNIANSMNLLSLDKRPIKYIDNIVYRKNGQAITADIGAYDIYSERYWNINEDGEWVYKTYNAKGIIVDTHKNNSLGTCSVIPKANYVVLNCYYNGYSLLPLSGRDDIIPMMWEAEYKNNEFSWGSPIVDKEDIILAINNSALMHVYVEGTPIEANISAKMYSIESDIGEMNDMPVSDIDSKQQWKPKAIHSGDITIYGWESVGYTDYVDIKHSPNDFTLIPSFDVILNMNGVYYKCSSLEPEYLSTDEITLEKDILYIDYDTNNAYEKDINGNINQVIYYNRADNVYSLNFAELEELLEQGAIKPAFKNEKLIFEDGYGNILLL